MNFDYKTLVYDAFVNVIHVDGYLDAYDVKDYTKCATLTLKYLKNRLIYDYDGGSSHIDDIWKDCMDYIIELCMKGRNYNWRFYETLYIMACTNMDNGNMPIGLLEPEALNPAVYQTYKRKFNKK